jgi:hypothetical protein
VLPSDLLGLGYLPDDVNLIAAVHVAEAEREAAGREFLNRFRLNEEYGLHTIETWTGLKLAEIDHVVLGIKVEGVAFPRAMFIVRSILPYDAVDLRRDLKATKLPGNGSRSLYRFEPASLGHDAVLWCPDQRTVVVGWTFFGGSDGKLEGVPDTPKSGTDRFPPKLRSVLDERIDPSARAQAVQAWVAAEPSWEKSPLVQIALTRFSRETQDLLSPLRALGAWAQFRESAKVRAGLQTTNSDAADKLEATVRDVVVKQRLPFGNPGPGTAAVLSDLARTLRISREGDWLSVEAEVTSQAMTGKPMPLGPQQPR